MSVSSHIGRERIERALRTVAQIVSRPGGEAYLPVFERLERELAALDGQLQAIERAKTLASITPIRARATRPGA